MTLNILKLWKITKLMKTIYQKYKCAINKKVDEINKTYFDDNKNESFEFKKIN